MNRRLRLYRTGVITLGFIEELDNKGRLIGDKYPDLGMLNI